MIIFLERMNLARSEVVGNLSNTAYLELRRLSLPIAELMMVAQSFQCRQPTRNFLGLDHT